MSIYGFLWRCPVCLIRAKVKFVVGLAGFEWRMQKSHLVKSSPIGWSEVEGEVLLGEEVHEAEVQLGEQEGEVPLGEPEAEVQLGEH